MARKKTNIEDVLKFMVKKYIWYGMPWMEWWKERGEKDFLVWAKKKNIEYVAEYVSKECKHAWVFSSADESGTRYFCAKCGELREE